MDAALAHIFGSDRGEPGLERAMFGTESGAVPEVWQIIKGQTVEQKLNKDYKLTIDQRFATDGRRSAERQSRRGRDVQSANRRSAGMYSNPSYSLKQVQDEAKWLDRLDNDRKERPLLESRDATNTTCRDRRSRP